MKEYYVNLQLFAGEKTEKATPKRRQEARKKGQILKSNEVNSVLILISSLILLKIFLPIMLKQIANYFYFLWNEFSLKNFSVENITPLMINLIYFILSLLLPLLIIIVFAGLAANLLQIGFLFTTDTLKVKFSRLNPVEGFKRIFSKRAFAELFKSVFKISLISYIAYIQMKNKINYFPLLMDMEIKEIANFIGNLMFSIIWKIALALSIIAVFDYFFQRYEYETSLKMSKQEIKDEYKNIEGDPQIKGKIKEKQRQLAMSRMMQEVPKADVIITNPTHFAIALKYEAKKMSAPVVVAKGKDMVALRIKKIAKDYGIITVENKKLAQLLYRSVEINDPVPEELYNAVAEVLAFVYRLKRKA